MEEFICCICNSILIRPENLKCCNQLICKYHLIDRPPSKCPICKTPNPEAESIHPAIASILEKTEFNCPNKERGCKENLTYRLIIQHIERGCEFDILSCPNNGEGCMYKCIRRDMEIHINECEHQTFKCKYWESGCSLLLNKIECEIHILECEYRKGICEGCKGEFIYRELSAHLEDCPQLQITCDKCSAILPRKNMLAHNCFIDFKLLFTNQFTQLKQEIGQLRSRIMLLENQNSLLRSKNIYSEKNQSNVQKIFQSWKSEGVEEQKTHIEQENTVETDENKINIQSTEITTHNMCNLEEILESLPFCKFCGHHILKEILFWLVNGDECCWKCKHKYIQEKRENINDNALKLCKLYILYIYIYIYPIYIYIYIYPIYIIR